MLARRFFLAAATLLLLLVATARTSPVPVADEEINYRIPTNVVPDNYRLVIRPEYPSNRLIDVKKFDGELVITATVTDTAAKKIVIHKANTITDIQILCILKLNEDVADNKDQNVVSGINSFCSDQDGTYVTRSSQTEDEVTETLTINLDEASTLAIGQKIRIVLVYEAVFREGALTGFYTSTYLDASKNPVAMLTTKFEPTYARQAFPCFDEPALKATFDLIVQNTTGVHVISNMEQAWRYNNDTVSIHYVAFHRTPKMSTYLLAFILYEEDSFTKTDEVLRPGNPVPYSTWGRKSMLTNSSDGSNAGQLSQVEGPAAIDFLERYTNIKYNATMTKMDMAAIPDFASGAMENWALVTYREVSLLYNQKTGTTTNYKRVLDVVAHELVHMWFGNLVTTHWWDSIWLNEGFARYLQYLVVHERYPNWRMLERFVIDEQMGVFGADADVGAAPITDDSVKSPTQIGNHFSTISYSKGGAILRQARNVMGEENFIAGVQAYLKARYLADATPDHLFDELVKMNKQEVTKLTNDQLKTALKAWSDTAGYPVITVTREGNTFNVSQERFLLTGTESTPSSYPVYLTYYSRANETVPTEPVPPQAWLKVGDSSILIEIENISSSDWVLFNVFQGGYYRVNYDEASWERLGAALDSGPEALARVAPLDRAAVVDNALALARAGRLPYRRALALLRFLRHDTAYEPWAAARAALAHLQRMVGDQPNFQKFVWYIVEGAYNATGFDEGPWDAHLDKVHRANVLHLACGAGYEPCLAEARRRLLQHLSYLPVTVPTDLESVVFCYGLKGDTGYLWQQLWDKYEDADSAQRATLVTALGCIDHRDTLKEFLQKSLNTEVRQQDAYTVFTSVAASAKGAEVALDFLTFWGYEKLEEWYGVVRNAMTTVISGLSNRLTTQAHKDQLEVAVEPYKSRHQGHLKTVQSNMDWLRDNQMPVLEDLEGAQEYRWRNGGPAPVAAASALVLLAAAALALLR